MDDQARIHRLRGQLELCIKQVLLSSIAYLREDRYANELDKVTGRLVEMISGYEAGQRAADRARHAYASSEAGLVAEFSEIGKDRKRRLRENVEGRMSEVLVAAVPSLNRPVYTSFIGKTARDLVNMLDLYQSTLMSQQGGAQYNYTRSERNLLAQFLIAATEAAGRDASAKDRLDSSINYVLAETGIEFSSAMRKYLITSFDRAFATYSAYKKLGDRKAAEEHLESAAKGLINDVNARFLSAQTKRAQESLDAAITAALHLADLGLEGFQVRSVHDQTLWLFRDYLRAPESERDEVYSLGEERIIFSLFSPISRRKGRVKQTTGAP